MSLRRTCSKELHFALIPDASIYTHCQPVCTHIHASICVQSPGSDHLDADGKPLPAWKVRMRQRHRFWSTSMGFKVTLH
jgi:hypothetical protein